MKLTVIGCAGSFAGPASPASCYLVQAEQDGRLWSILLDMGNGSLGALQRHLDPCAVDAVFLTHLHPDHCLDLTGFYVYRKYHPGGPCTHRVPVYAPAGAEDRIHAAYEGIDADGMNAQLDFRVVGEGSVVEVGPFRLTTHAMNHPVETYGYRVEAGGSVLAFTDDTDTCPGLLTLAAHADLLLTDCAFVDGRDPLPDIHLSGSRAAAAAVAAGAKRLMLTHIPAWNDPQVCRAQAAAVWPGEVELAAPDANYVI